MKYNLSEITHLIRNRRTIFPEDYSPRKVHREIVELILTNATWAPTHGLTQPWRFKVFTNEGLGRLAAFLQSSYRRTTDAEKFREAKFDRIAERCRRTSVVIAICMERDRTHKIAEMEEIEGVACAVQNMYLTATAYGIGAYWSSPAYLYTPEANAFFGIAPEDKCLGIFYMGYTDSEWPSGHRKPLEYVTEWIDQ